MHGGATHPPTHTYTHTHACTRPAAAAAAPPQSDYISFRHHTYEMPKGAKSITLKECGPRFELKLYQIKLGTLDQPHAENGVCAAQLHQQRQAQQAGDGRG